VLTDRDTKDNGHRSCIAHKNVWSRRSKI